MNALRGLVGSVSEWLAPAPPRPQRRRETRALKVVPAVSAGVVAAVAALAVYYLSLGLLPPATAYPTTLFPVSLWAHRFDLAQFFGALILPPYPSPRSWLLGLALFGGMLSSLGLVYALLLAWALETSDAKKGVGFGALVFGALAFAVTLGNGFHPAVMRNALPDTGLLLLGWSPLAAGQLLLTFLLYGALLGYLYARWTPSALSRKPR